MGTNYGPTPGDYLPLLILIVLAAVISALLVGLSAVLGPKRPSDAKLSPYECGVDPVGNARDRFPVKFYVIAMLFIVFDIETVFLYPWTALFRNSALAFRGFLLGEMLVFLAILFVGYIYIWKKGALDWE